MLGTLAEISPSPITGIWICIPELVESTTRLGVPVFVVTEPEIVTLARVFSSELAIDTEEAVDGELEIDEVDDSGVA